MELDPAVKSRVWWGGAIKAALKGIPQGLLLGALAGVAMFALIGGMMLMGGAVAGVGLTIAQGMGSFVYGHAALTAVAGLTPAAVAAMPHAALATALAPLLSWHSISLLTIAPFNAVLGAVGNFLSGGNIAVNAAKQQTDHDANVARLEQLEGREMAIEQAVNPPSRAVGKILAGGPRTRDSFADAETQRAAASTTPTLH